MQLGKRNNLRILLGRGEMEVREWPPLEFVSSLQGHETPRTPENILQKNCKVSIFSCHRYYLCLAHNDFLKVNYFTLQELRISSYLASFVNSITSSCGLVVFSLLCYYLNAHTMQFHASCWSHPISVSWLLDSLEAHDIPLDMSLIDSCKIPFRVFG